MFGFVTKQERKRIEVEIESCVAWEHQLEPDSVINQLIVSAEYYKYLFELIVFASCEGIPFVCQFMNTILFY